MAVALSLLLSFTGLLALGAGLDRHQRHLFGRQLPGWSVKALRLAAAACLILAPVPWALERGAAMALVTWLFCGLPVVGLVVAGLMTLDAERRR